MVEMTVVETVPDTELADNMPPEGVIILPLPSHPVIRRTKSWKQRENYPLPTVQFLPVKLTMWKLPPFQQITC